MPESLGDWEAVRELQSAVAFRGRGPPSTATIRTSYQRQAAFGLGKVKERPHQPPQEQTPRKWESISAETRSPRGSTSIAWHSTGGGRVLKAALRKRVPGTTWPLAIWKSCLSIIPITSSLSSVVTDHSSAEHQRK